MYRQASAARSSAEAGTENRIEEAVISVTDPVRHGDGVNAYTSYRVVTKIPSSDSETTSIRRFSDFEWLHSRLCSAHRGIIVPPLPEKNVVEKFRFSKEFVEARSRALEKFINRVARHPELGRAPELRHFLHDDEQIWAQQIAAPAEPKSSVFGRTNDYLSLLKDVQWSLSSVVMGGGFPGAAATAGRAATAEMGTGGPPSAAGEEEAAANKELRAYAEELEAKFGKAHREAVLYLRKQRDTANSLASLGRALIVLGRAEEGGSGADGSKLSEKQQQQQDVQETQTARAPLAMGVCLGEAMADVGNRCETVAGMMLDQGSAFSEKVEEVLKEYVRIAQSFKRVVSDRAAALQEEWHLEAEVATKRSRWEKLRATPAASMERLRDLESELEEVKRRVAAARAEGEKLRQRMEADLQRFHETMLADMGALVANSRSLHMDLAQRSAECWKEGLPLLARTQSLLESAARRQLQQHDQSEDQ